MAASRDTKFRTQISCDIDDETFSVIILDS